MINIKILKTIIILKNLIYNKKNYSINENKNNKDEIDLFIPMLKEEKV